MMNLRHLLLSVSDMNPFIMSFFDDWFVFFIVEVPLIAIKLVDGIFMVIRIIAKVIIYRGLFIYIYIPSFKKIKNRSQ